MENGLLSASHTKLQAPKEKHFPYLLCIIES